MITGVHTLVYANDHEPARAFFKDVLGLDHVDVGGGWLIFALPPAEIAVHPTDGAPTHEITLMCDDLDATQAELEAKGIEFVGEREEHDWGLVAYIQVPGAGKMMVYEPRHASPLTN